MKVRAFSFGDELESPTGKPLSPNRNKSANVKDLFTPAEYQELSKPLQNPFDVPSEEAKVPETIQVANQGIPELAKPPEYAEDRELYVGSPDMKLAKRDLSNPIKEVTEWKIEK